MPFPACGGGPRGLREAAPPATPALGGRRRLPEVWSKRVVRKLACRISELRFGLGRPSVAPAQGVPYPACQEASHIHTTREIVLNIGDLARATPVASLAVQVRHESVCLFQGSDQWASMQSVLGAKLAWLRSSTLRQHMGSTRPGAGHGRALERGGPAAGLSLSLCVSRLWPLPLVLTARRSPHRLRDPSIGLRLTAPSRHDRCSSRLSGAEKPRFQCANVSCSVCVVHCSIVGSSVNPQG